MLRLLDIFMFTFERLWQNRALVFWALIGLAAATTLALSIVLYVDAVNTDLLISRLSNPPFGFRFRYLGDWEGNVAQEDVDRADDAMQQEIGTVDGQFAGELMSQYLWIDPGAGWRLRAPG